MTRKGQPHRPRLFTNPGRRQYLQVRPITSRRGGAAVVAVVAWSWLVSRGGTGNRDRPRAAVGDGVRPAVRRYPSLPHPRTGGRSPRPSGGRFRQPRRTGRAGAASGPQGRRPHRAGRGALGRRQVRRPGPRARWPRNGGRMPRPSAGGHEAGGTGAGMPPLGWGRGARRPARVRVRRAGVSAARGPDGGRGRGGPSLTIQLRQPERTMSP